MQTGISEAWTALGKKDVGAALFSFPVLEILMQHPTCLIHEIDITRFCPFSPEMKPPTFCTDMSIIQLEVNDVGHTTAHPVAQCKEGFATAILLLHQVLQDQALDGREDPGIKRCRGFRGVNDDTTSRVALKQRLVLD